MTTETTTTHLAARRVGDRVGAVDEYTSLQHAALDRLVHCGIESAAAVARLRAGIDRLGDDLGLDPDEVERVVAPLVAATEAALAEVQADYHRLTIQVLRLGRARLGLS